MEKASISTRIKIVALVFVIALLLPVLVMGIFVGSKPADIPLAAIAASVMWFTRSK